MSLTIACVMLKRIMIWWPKFTTRDTVGTRTPISESLCRLQRTLTTTQSFGDCREARNRKLRTTHLVGEVPRRQDLVFLLPPATTNRKGLTTMEFQRPNRKKARFCEGVKPETFFEIGRPHAYGVQSGGNRFLSSEDKDQESTEPTKILQGLLSDEQWIDVLQWLPGRDLARLSMASRYFYVVAHTPELWRDLVLAQKQTMTITETTWKDTFVSRESKTMAPHQPLSIPGIFSDYLFRQHVCRSFAMPETWLEGLDTTVQQTDAANISSETFLRSFEEPNKPLLVKGGASKWSAFQKWNDDAYCQSQTKGRTFRTTSGMAPRPANFTWSAYRSYCQSSLLEEGPLYLFDRTALQPGSAMHEDFMVDMKRTCPYWDPDAPFHDHFGLIGEGRRPDHTWLIAGPKRSGSVFHVDPNATHAWNAAITGRKRWIFYPPGCTPPGVHPSPDKDEVALPLSIGEWLCSFWAEHLKRPERLECTAMPGDIVFVPHGWWHMVINLDDFNLAITHNYVSDSNLANVLRFLSTKREQVSGCRDRPESVKPDRLYEEFTEALRLQRPHILEEASKIKEWTCPTWKPVQQKTSIMEKAKSMEGSGFSFSFQ